MIRHALIIALAACLVVAPAAAEDDDDLVPDFDDLRTPTSPGFTLLGLTPSQVERPSTPNGLAVAVGGVLSEGSGAVEVAPYWLWSRPTLTLQQYIDRGVGTQLWQNASLSLAAVTADEISGAISGTTSVAVGLRTGATWARKELPKACTDEIQAMKAQAVIGISAHPDFNRINLLPEPQRTEEMVKLKQKVIDAHPVTERAEKCLGVADASSLTMQLAFATSVDFADRLPREGSLGASAVWATLAKRWIGANLVATTRLRRNVFSDTGDFYIEPGLRGIYTSGRFAASAELVGRIQVLREDAVPESEATYRAALVAEVRIADDTWLSVSFGQDFGAGAASGPLFSLANLEWSFGDPTVKVEAE